MQIGVVAKKVGVSVGAVRFYERNGLLPRPPRIEGGFRAIRGQRGGNAGLRPARAGLGIQAEGDSRALATTREPLAAMRSCEVPIGRKAG